MEEENKPYDFETLLDVLEDIRCEGRNSLNLPGAIYCLSLEIKKIILYQERLHSLIPLKYKKVFPKEGENPFFSKEEIQPNAEDYAAAKERVRLIKEKIAKEMEEKALRESIKQLNDEYWERASKPISSEESLSAS